MLLRSLTFHVGPGVDVEYVSNALVELGALSVTLTDRNRGTDKEEMITREPLSVTSVPTGDIGVLEFEAKRWEEASIIALFSLVSSAHIEKVCMRLAADYDLPFSPSLSMVSNDVVEEDQRDWVSHGQRTCKPVKVGRVVIRFPWNEYTPESSSRNVCLVQLDPGIAFGTGEHATTKLIISWLQNTIQEGDVVLDYGSGSGILAIVAAALGAGAVVGVDIDPEAVASSKENARINFGEDACKRVQFGPPGFEQRHEFAGQSYDIVVANILAQPLKNLAELLVSQLAPRGRVALAGVLACQANDVCNAYKKLGVRIDVAEAREDWVLIAGQKIGVAMQSAAQGKPKN